MTDKLTFETYQPATIQPNHIVEPSCFNGQCLIRRYRVTVELIDEPKDVLTERLVGLWEKRGATHTDNMQAMVREAKRLGVDLFQSRPSGKESND